MTLHISNSNGFQAFDRFCDNAALVLCHLPQRSLFIHIINIRIMFCDAEGRAERVSRLIKLYIVLIPAFIARTEGQLRYLIYRLQFDAKCNLFMALAVSPSTK